MAKFSGNIGFATPIEIRPGVVKDQITVKHYSGDLLDLDRRTTPSTNLNDNLNLIIKVSIIADPYVNKNIQAIRYVEFMGAKWKITNINPQYPRLILTTGGVYNGK